METLEIIINFLIYITLFSLVILILLLLNKVKEFHNELLYLKSIYEQAVQISEKTEKKLTTHINNHIKSHKQSFTIGYTKGQKNGSNSIQFR